ncbi:MAG: AAA family ATPase [Roseiarcus sp.]
MTFVSEIVRRYYPLNRESASATQASEPLLIDKDGIALVDAGDDDVRTPTEILRGDVALAAVLLDGVGATPANFESGVHVIYVADRLIDGVQKVIEATSSRSFHSSYSFSTGKPSDAFWISGRYDERAVVAALQSNALLIGVASSDADLPTGFAQVVDREWDILAITVDHIEATIRLMTGVAVSLPDRKYDADSVLKALRPGAAAAKVVLNLKALHKNDWDDDDANETDAAADIADLADKTIQADRDESESPGDEAKKAVTRLRDLSGYGEARTWGMQLAADLADYKSGKLDWEDIDKGLLLSGPPGCGKSFYARALAEECQVPLLLSSYADWESATGTGNLIAKSIKKAFADARKKAPCIVFIDEIDSVGSRGKRDHNSGWFDVVINALLAELDGAEPRTGVVVIGATNYPASIDPALLRPGRLDRHIAIPRPTIADLTGILAHHLGHLGGLDQAARDCRGLSPAEIAQVAREARRLARKCKRKVTAGDVSDVIACRRRAPDPDFERIVCIHEAGHAIVFSKLGFAVEFVDADNTQTLASLPAGSPKIDEIERHLAGTMGGRAAEIAIFGEPSHGSMSDLEQATSMAYLAISKAGLGGSLISLPDNLAISLPDVRKRVEDLLTRAMDRASKVIAENRPALDALAAALAESRYLDAHEIKAVIGSVKTPGVRKVGAPKEMSDDQRQLS